MKKDPQNETLSRRLFLRNAAVTGGAAAAAITAPGAAIADTAQSPKEAAKTDGYRLTQHILDYYKSAAR